MDKSPSDSKLIKNVFAVMALISCFTCYCRPDYNLPLFAFAYLLWDHTNPSDRENRGSQKQQLLYLMTFTWVVDGIWLIKWGNIWTSNVYAHNWAKGIQDFVFWLCLINFLIKFFAIIYSNFYLLKGTPDTIDPSKDVKAVLHDFTGSEA